MVRLQLFRFSLILYCTLNILIYHHIYSCSGPEVVASGVYAEKIKMARSLFTKSINFPEPKYYIKITQCHNAWADSGDTNKAKIIVTEPVIKYFSTEELAGILGHELAHIQAHTRNEIPNHWKIDIAGAELTSKKIEISQLDRMLKEFNYLFEKNKLLMLAFPLSYLEYAHLKSDFSLRIEKVNNYFK